jgi:hypothetical protein
MWDINPAYLTVLFLVPLWMMKERQAQLSSKDESILLTSPLA